MPGAFTPSCSAVHLPGFVDKADAFVAAGVQTIGICTTNDRFVNAAWETSSPAAEAALASGAVKLVSDPEANLLEALGMYEYLGAEYGTRSKRFAMIVTNGSISHLAVDEGTKDVKQTSADAIFRVVTGMPTAEEEAQAQTNAAVGALAVAAAAAFVFSGEMGSIKMPSTANVAAPKAAAKPKAAKPQVATKFAATSDKAKVKAEAAAKAKALKMEAKKERAEAAKIATAAALRQANI